MRSDWSDRLILRNRFPTDEGSIPCPCHPPPLPHYSEINSPSNAKSFWKLKKARKPQSYIYINRMRKVKTKEFEIFLNSHTFTQIEIIYQHTHIHTQRHISIHYVHTITPVLHDRLSSSCKFCAFLKIFLINVMSTFIL